MISLKPIWFDPHQSMLDAAQTRHQNSPTLMWVSVHPMMKSHGRMCLLHHVLCVFAVQTKQGRRS